MRLTNDLRRLICWLKYGKQIRFNYVSVIKMATNGGQKKAFGSDAKRQREGQRQLRVVMVRHHRLKRTRARWVRFDQWSKHVPAYERAAFELLAALPHE